MLHIIQKSSPDNFGQSNRKLEPKRFEKLCQSKKKKLKPRGFTWEPTQYGVFNDPSPSTFQENVWIKAKKYLVCNLAKTDRGEGEGLKGIRNPLTLASAFFLTAARLHRALFVCQ